MPKSSVNSRPTTRPIPTEIARSSIMSPFQSRAVAEVADQGQALAADVGHADHQRRLPQAHDGLEDLVEVLVVGEDETVRVDAHLGRPRANR